MRGEERLARLEDLDGGRVHVYFDEAHEQAMLAALIPRQGTPEPDVLVPLPQYGTPACPVDWCGYKCGCCCHCNCQTPCPTPDVDGDCPHTDGHECHGGHEPWDCANFITRYYWAKAKSDRLWAQIRADEGAHGPWDKDQQRYEDGCKSGAGPHT